MREFVRTARSRLTVRRALTAAVVFAATVGVFGAEADVAAGVAIAIVSMETVRTLRATPNVDGHRVEGAVGVFAVAVSLVLFGTGGSPLAGTWLPAVTLLAGGWLILDALAPRGGVAAPEPEAVSTTEAVFRSFVQKLVVDELTRAPRTEAELVEMCGVSRSRVRRGLETLEANGVVRRQGDAYVLDETEFGWAAFVRGNLARVGRRLARPVRR